MGRGRLKGTVTDEAVAISSGVCGDFCDTYSLHILLMIHQGIKTVLYNSRVSGLWSRSESATDPIVKSLS